MLLDLLFLIFIHLKPELLTQIPALNDRNISETKFFDLYLFYFYLFFIFVFLSMLDFQFIRFQTYLKM